MLSKKLQETLKKQHYVLIGKHSAVQICRWTKNSLREQGHCYKQQFYGIKSHLCCQMSPSVGFCQNRCLHCWRAIELTEGNKMSEKQTDNPETIIQGCIQAQQKLLNGFKGNPKTNLTKFKQAQEPENFAISLTGEPTLYPKLGELIQQLREKGKSTFIVTNGLQPETLKKLQKNKQLPTQLYVSLNTPNEKMFKKWHKSTIKDAWKKLNQTLNLFPKLKTRKVIRMTLVKNANTKPEHIEQYSELIKKAQPDFIEVKGFMSVGFSRNRKGMGYDAMPTHEEIRDYAERIAISLKNNYKILDEHERSRVILIGKDKSKMKIKKSEI
ncbi:4-demethylwyosine synthase TYW1 [archaeon]|jgi:tRNA wybutosine-synthesizing protein 1|nr:4-demethylwyosine synthase TYW1 [archaeon]